MAGPLPGPRNAITDVGGLSVGNAHDERIRSGVTVVVCQQPATAAVDVRGGAPGTRETDALDPSSLVGAVDAVVLAGGSAFGLEAAAGVSAWLAAQHRGFAVGPVRVPIVPAAILFDLLNGGDKDWGGAPPYRALGDAACRASGADFLLGNAGAGFGAVSGRIKGGLGTASAVFDDGLAVGALVAVNSLGSAVIPGTQTLWAWAAERGAEFSGAGPPGAMPDRTIDDRKQPPRPGANTTVAVVATNAVLSAAQVRRVAIMAHDGIARAIRPAHTPFDGDSVFALATGQMALSGPLPEEVTRIGVEAAECLERAIGRAVYEARAMGDIPAFRDR